MAQGQKIKISSCQRCQGAVRVAGVELMAEKEINDFAMEAHDHNLSIREITIDEYHRHKLVWCQCG